MSKATVFKVGFARAAAAVAFAGMILSGCSTLQPIEPVISPPSNYQGNATVQVEFVHPAMVGLRCAERGAKLLGVPMVTAGACADEALITMSNPCFAPNGGWYARTLCHELAHVNGWAHNHSGGSMRWQPPMQMASMSPEAIAYAQAEAQQRLLAQAATEQAPTIVTVAASGTAASVPSVALRGTQSAHKTAARGGKARPAAPIALETASALP